MHAFYDFKAKTEKYVDLYSQGGHLNSLYTGGGDSIREFQYSPNSIKKTCTHPKLSSKLLGEIQGCQNTNGVVGNVADCYLEKS